MLYALFFLFITCLFVLRGRLDSFLIAALGIFIYYFPIFFNLLWVLDPRGMMVDVGMPASTELLISILFIYLLLYFFSVIPSFRLFTSNSKNINIILISDKIIYLFSLIFAFVLSIYILPTALQYSGKTARAAAIGYGHVLFEYSFSLAIAFSFYFFIHTKKIINLLVFLYLVFVATFIFQTRAVSFFSIIAVLVSIIYGKNYNIKTFNVLKLKRLKFLVFLIVVFIVFIGKHLANSFFYGVEYDDWFMVILDSIESFLISSSLNYVYMSGLKEFTLSGFFYNFIPGMSSVDYHDFIKEKIFYESNYGMGRNPIGELWINFRWIGVFIYSLILISKCFIFNRILMKSEGLLKVFFTILMLYGTFYVNRNSIQTDIVFMRNYFLLLLLLVFLSSLFLNTPLVRFKKIHKKV